MTKEQMAAFTTPDKLMESEMKLSKRISHYF